MRTELKRIEAIAENSDGALEALKRHVTGADVYEKFITNLIFSVYPAALALAHNTDKSNEGISWIQRTAKSQYIRPDDMTRIRRVAGDRLAEFAESIDDLFAAYESLYKRDEIESPRKAVGVSVCFFEEDKADADMIR